MSDNKLRAGILIVSETASRDPSTDKCGPILQDVFRDDGGDQWEVAETKIVPDSISEIQSAVKQWSDGEDALNLVVTSGGTGFAVKDRTPEVSRRTPMAEVGKSKAYNTFEGRHPSYREACARPGVSRHAYDHFKSRV